MTAAESDTSDRQRLCLWVREHGRAIRGFLLARIHRRALELKRLDNELHGACARRWTGARRPAISSSDNAFLTSWVPRKNQPSDELTAKRFSRIARGCRSGYPRDDRPNTRTPKGLHRGRGQGNRRRQDDNPSASL